MNRVHNFSAGPAALPTEVLEQARDEMLDYQGSGVSIMEMSHRSADYVAVAEKAEQIQKDGGTFQGHIKISAQQEDRSEYSGIAVRVEDNGPGVPEALRNKIMDAFFTTKPPGEGAGLGLNISHNIVVQKHKGKITVNSQPGKTCFKVELPINFETTQ